MTYRDLIKKHGEAVIKPWMKERGFRVCRSCNGYGGRMVGPNRSQCHRCNRTGMVWKPSN
jgi:hypothetical protein